MSMGEPTGPTLEEMARIAKERTLSDAELLKGGAEYVVNENGETANLLVTEEQKKHNQNKYTERESRDLETKEDAIKVFYIRAHEDSSSSGSTISFRVETGNDGAVSVIGTGESLMDGRHHCSLCAKAWEAIDLLGPTEAGRISQSFVFSSQGELKEKLNDIGMLDGIEARIVASGTQAKQEN